jgi:hypothetical protein
MRRHLRPALSESLAAPLHQPPLCVIALLLAGALAGCAAALPPPARPTPAVFASRDARSQEFCALRAKARGYADTDMAVNCRREEYSAEARARSITINGDVDRSCEDIATYGGPNGPFSWSVYMDCIDDSI